MIINLKTVRNHLFLILNGTVSVSYGGNVTVNGTKHSKMDQVKLVEDRH